jgi:hypothetical protein
MIYFEACVTLIINSGLILTSNTIDMKCHLINPIGVVIPFGIQAIDEQQNYLVTP